MPQTHSTPCAPDGDIGVYAIVNVVRGKRYVGSSAKSIKVRWWLHRTALRAGKHHSRHLQRAWDKYGEDAFSFEVLEVCPPEQCVAREQHWIDHHKAADGRYGYNVSPTAGSQLGIKRSEETKAKLRARKMSDETKAKLRAALTGRKLSAENRKKISDAQKGRRNSEETIAKMSAAAKRRWMRPGLLSDADFVTVWDASANVPAVATQIGQSLTLLQKSGKAAARERCNPQSNADAPRWRSQAQFGNHSQDRRHSQGSRSN
jgi:group I intron endonuclease